MRKVIILSFVSALFFARSYASAEGTVPVKHEPAAIRGVVAENPAASKVTTTFKVRIALVDIHGAPVNNGALRGYWAHNVATGEYFYPGGQEDEDKFGNLPAGTYTFGAYPGNWDGAVSKTVTLNNGNAGPDGYIVVQLTYWVE